MPELTEEQLRFLRNQFESGAFGEQSCFDYVSDYGSAEVGGAYVEIFVEPCGNITKWGGSLAEVAQWWIDVFRAQPSTLGYAESGYILEDKAADLPNNPRDVWEAVNA